MPLDIDGLVQHSNNLRQAIDIFVKLTEHI